MIAEDRHHPSLAVRVLSGTVDVAQPADGMGDPIRFPPRDDVGLRSPFRSAVGRDRCGYGVLGGGDRRRVAVQRAARGGEGHLRLVTGRRLEHVQGPEHVDLAIAPRVGHRHDHARLRRQMKDDRGPGRVDRAIERLAVGDVDHFERRLAGDTSGVAGGEIVHDDHFPVLGEQQVHDVRTDETGSSGHYCSGLRHPMSPLSRSCGSKPSNERGGRSSRANEARGATAFRSGSSAARRSARLPWAP